MKSFLKYFLISITAVLLISCSDDNNPQLEDESFFNLNVGNLWIYKRYDNSYSNPEVFTFNGLIDSVKIIEHIQLEGITVAKKWTKRINVNNNNHILFEKISYVYVNNLGHLKELQNYIPEHVLNGFGNLLHPGLDYNLNFTTDFQGFGTIEHTLSETVNINVEGQEFIVVPFLGYFTPSPQYPNIEPKIMEHNYQKKIGLVLRVCPSLSIGTFEERLVHYEITD